MAVAFFVAVLFVFASCSKKSNEASSGEKSGETVSSSKTKKAAKSKSKKARTPNPRTDFSYELNESGDGVVITSYKGTGSTTVVIPDTIEDYPVVGIGDNVFFYARTGVDSGHQVWNSWLSKWVNVSKPFDYVYVPRTVAYVGEKAFAGDYTKLEDGSRYFIGIQELDIDLSNIKSLGSAADGNFANARFSNTDIVISADWDSSFKDSDWQRAYTGIFAGANITSVTFSEGCDKIQENMFKSCSELKSVTIPASVKEIGLFAFEDCEKLEEVSFVEGATIKYSEEPTFRYNKCFRGCSALPLGVRAKIQATGYKDEF